MVSAHDALQNSGPEVDLPANLQGILPAPVFMEGQTWRRAALSSYRTEDNAIQVRAKRLPRRAGKPGLFRPRAGAGQRSHIPAPPGSMPQESLGQQVVQVGLHCGYRRMCFAIAAVARGCILAAAAGGGRWWFGLAVVVLR